MLRPLFDNVWGVPVITNNETWSESTLIRPVMAKREKLTHLIRVCEIGNRCEQVCIGDIVILPEDNGGSVVEVLLEDGRVQRRYCFSEKQALAVWYGDLPGKVDTTLAEPKTI